MKKINRLITYFLAVAMLISSVVMLSSCIGTPSSTESDHLGAPSDTSDTGGDENSYPKWDIGEEELEEIYQRALTSKKNKEYQYAHALFSLLARKNYKDSADLEKELRTDAYSQKLIPYVLFDNISGGKNCSVKNISYGDKTVLGVLYIAEGGVPKYAYYDPSGKYCELIPDTTLKDVISIIASPDGHNTTGKMYPYYYTCIKKDGSVSLIYNEKEYSQSEEYSLFSGYVDFVKELKNVCDIRQDPENASAYILHTDGKVSYYKGYSIYDTEVLDRFVSSDDYVKLLDFTPYVIGLREGGTVASEYVYETTALKPNCYEYLKNEDLSVDGVYFGVCIIGGRAYKLWETSIGDVLKYRTENGSYADIEKIVYVNSERYVNLDGQIYEANKLYDNDRIDGVAFIVNDSTRIKTDGSVVYNGQDADKYPYDKIKIGM